MREYSELVVREEVDSFACPDTRNLTMYDGSRWYVRLRWGYARLGRDDRHDNECSGINMKDLDSDSDGVFADHQEFERTFMRLAQEHPGMHSLLYGVSEGEAADNLKELISAATEARDFMDDTLENERRRRNDDYDFHRMHEAVISLDLVLKEYGVKSRGY
jgi:hypothetical protein